MKPLNRKSMSRRIQPLLVSAMAALLCGVPFARGQIETVKVTGGELRGVVKDGVTVFKGISFAAPPVGDLRWRPPQPVQPWTGVKAADHFAPAPMQDAMLAMLMGGAANFSEDCLYLNVWSPAKTAGRKTPRPRLDLRRRLRQRHHLRPHYYDCATRPQRPRHGLHRLPPRGLRLPRPP